MCISSNRTTLIRIKKPSILPIATHTDDCSYGRYAHAQSVNWHHTDCERSCSSYICIINQTVQNDCEECHNWKHKIFPVTSSNLKPVTDEEDTEGIASGSFLRRISNTRGNFNSLPADAPHSYNCPTGSRQRMWRDDINPRVERACALLESYLVSTTPLDHSPYNEALITIPASASLTFLCSHLGFFLCVYTFIAVFSGETRDSQTRSWRTYTV